MAKLGFAALAVCIVLLTILAIWLPSLASELGATAFVLFIVLIIAFVVRDISDYS
jgi:hypothetical protein